MKKVIGIISYLPDNKELRNKRLDLLNKLISKLNSIFSLPIYIVCQNYCNNETKFPNNVLLSQNYDKLGIVGARKKLREWFISSDYDCLIMLDDDCIIYGSKSDADNYLKQLDNNPNMFYEFNGTLLKLFAISKDIFKQVDFEDVNPELGEGFEDRIFVSKLRKYFQDKRVVLNQCKLYENSVSTRDSNSTWYTNQNIEDMLSNTNNIINCKL